LIDLSVKLRLVCLRCRRRGVYACGCTEFGHNSTQSAVATRWSH